MKARKIRMMLGCGVSCLGPPLDLLLRQMGQQMRLDQRQVLGGQAKATAKVLIHLRRVTSIHCRFALLQLLHAPWGTHCGAPQQG